jgi:hypothetical protein
MLGRLAAEERRAVEPAAAQDRRLAELRRVRVEPLRTVVIRA